MKQVKKPWGQEIWIAHENGRYAGKLIKIRSGNRLSKQYHKVKHETLYLLEGEAIIFINDEPEEKLFEGDIITIIPETIHRLEAVTDCIFIEFSTPELDDVVRLEDDYGRKDN